METKNPTTDAELLTKLNQAVAAANDAEKTATTAQAELVSRSKVVGTLLLEAKKLHPKVKDFEEFLKRVDGLKLSRAYDLMRLAGGRTTDEELRTDARDRQRKSRSSKKKVAPPPKKLEPKSEPKRDSVTGGSVTETAEVSTEKHETGYADFLNAEEKAAEASARALAEFTFACRQYLPKMREADREKARKLVSKMTSSNQAEAA